MKDDLSHLTAAQIDALPFGYVALATDGTVRRYNRYEADLTRKDPAEVLGKSFFRQVAPCTQVQELEGRFRDFVSDADGPPTLTFDFELRFRHGHQKVRIGFVRSPLEREVIVTVNRRRERELPTAVEVSAQPVRGALVDAAGARVVACGADFWIALEALFESHDGEARHGALHKVGRAWARRHLDRAEALAQGDRQRALREVELQVALEILSGSLATLGLGAFDADFSHRDQGLVVIEHRHSPFAAAGEGWDDGRGGAYSGRCDLLAGLHAGFVSYLAGRELVARETTCSRAPEAVCRFAVGTALRLDRLFAAEAGSPDAALRAHLTRRSAAEMEMALALEADDDAA